MEQDWRGCQRIKGVKGQCRGFTRAVPAGVTCTLECLNGSPGVEMWECEDKFELDTDVGREWRLKSEPLSCGCNYFFFHCSLFKV